ncbi:MAG: GMC family oxidoreductase [Symploca sp. SIO1C2]|nr:GMC family oxidoreductase [Symploca sp. SIO1C2]
MQQAPNTQNIMNDVFFLSSSEWHKTQATKKFDYIVIGTGFCALGFIERVLKQDANARILLIEQGSFFLPEHVQNLPTPYQKLLVKQALKAFPWTVSPQTLNHNQYIKWQHGIVPFFGGGSTIWSAWCPEPTTAEMRDWPPATIKAAQDYFQAAKNLLNVIPANDEQTGKIFEHWQEQLTQRLKQNLHKIKSATRIEPAQIAVGTPTITSTDVEKFSTPGPLLNEVVKCQEEAKKHQIDSRLSIVTECTVTEIRQQENQATALETTRGVLNVGDSKVILAMGNIQSTTLVLNSFPQAKNAGKRFTAHFISAIVARIPREDFLEIFDWDENLKDDLRKKKLELAAIYLAGVDQETEGQYHIQLSAISDPDPTNKTHIDTAARNMPDVLATASPKQLETSQDYIVFVCAVLGELFDNPGNGLEKNDHDDPISNVTLQVLETDKDLSVWDTMDKATFEVLEQGLSPRGKDRVEYWHGDPDTGQWQHKRHKIRVPGLVHEASTMWIGDDEEAVVALDYRLKGVENVYITGASLWPTGGSWNPTLTMVALAQHLADNLTSRGA